MSGAEGTVAVIGIGRAEGGCRAQGRAEERIALRVGLLEGEYLCGREQSRWKSYAFASCLTFAQSGTLRRTGNRICAV